jgi:hypothetical protein
LDIANAASDGTEEPAFDIGDQEAVYRSLPSCLLPPLSLDRHERVALTCFPATLFLPSPESAEPTEVPDVMWQGWDWRSGDAMLLMILVEPELPKLRAITNAHATMCHAIIAGRPMGIRRLAPGDPGWFGDCYAAEVYGFVNDSTEFWAQVRSLTAAGRDLLLAAVASLALA